MKKIIIAILLLSLVALIANSSLTKTEVKEESNEYHLTKQDLNKPISPHKVHFYIQTSGDEKDRKFSLIVTANRKSTYKTKTKKRLDGQIYPDIIHWEVLDDKNEVSKKWEPAFRNRTRSGPGDRLQTTIYSIPKEDLVKSRLRLYFEDVDQDEKRDDTVFYIDMKDFNWSTTSTLIYKPIVQ